MPTLREQHLLAFFYLPLAGGGSAAAAAPRPPNHVDVDATLAHTGRARGRPAQAVAAHVSVTERGPPRDGIVAAHLRGIRSGRQGLPRKEKGRFSEIIPQWVQRPPSTVHMVFLLLA